MLDTIVAHYPSTEERAEAASAILHEINRRTRRAIRTASFLKCCPSCNTAKRHDAYNRDASRPDGLDWRCRACRIGSGS